MRAAFLEKAGVIALRDYEEPAPLKPDDVCIRIMASGVCGSDVHFFEHGRIGPFIVERPLILGHELSGVVEELGSNVARLKVGDRVSVEPGVPCFQCETCKRGFYNICSHVTFLGSPPEIHGSFRESIVHHQAMCHVLPDTMSFEEGAMIEPLSVAVHSCLLGKVGMGDLVAVLGAGPIGLLIAQVAKACGGQAIACEVIGSRLQAAKDFGANQIIHSGEEDVKQAVLSRWGRQPSVVFEAAGAKAAHQMALDLVAPGGTVVFVGWSHDPEIPLNVHLMGSKELTVKGQFRYRNVFAEAITLAQSGKVDLKRLITHRYSLEAVPEALNLASRREEGTVKIIVTPDGR